MGHDEGNGAMSLKNDHLRIEWPDKEGIFKKANEIMYELCKEDCSIYVCDPLYQKMSDFNLITVHPLGGVVMGQDAKQGAVNHAGKLYSSSEGTSVYDSLLVCDGSIIPTPLGVNPLYTICALCERIASLLAKERGWKIDMSGGDFTIDF
jgi:cholesterol oxidase